MAHSLKKHLQDLLAKDKLEELIEYLLNPRLNIPEDVQEEVRLISGISSYLNKNVRLMQVSREEMNVERSKLRVSLSAIIDKVPNDIPYSEETAPHKDPSSTNSIHKKDNASKKKHRYGWLIHVSIYLALGIIILIVLFQPKKNLRFKAKILVDQFTFTYLDKGYHLAEVPIIEARISNFTDVSISGDYYSIDEEGLGNWGPNKGISSSIMLNPLINPAGVNVNIFGDLRLDNQIISNGAKMTLSRAEALESPNLVRFSINQTQPIEGVFSYFKNAQLSVEEVTVKGLEEYTEITDPIDLSITGPEDSQREIRFTSGPGTFFLTLLTKDSLDIKNHDWEIKTPEFTKPSDNLNNPNPVSSILEGEIIFVEPQSSALMTLDLHKNDMLSIETNDILNMESLHITDKGILVVLSGHLDHLGIGPRNESYNPTLIKWLWHNHLWYLIGAGILLLGSLFFFPKYLRHRILELLSLGKNS